MKKLDVTDINELMAANMGEVIPMPPFAMDTVFNARIKRLSITTLVKMGKIPNPLLKSVYAMFSDKEIDKKIEDDNIGDAEKNMLDDFTKFVDIVVSECLVSPNVAELREAGLVLNDEQKLHIFDYVQNGVRVLEPFFRKYGDYKNSLNDTNVEYTS